MSHFWIIFCLACLFLQAGASFPVLHMIWFSRQLKTAAKIAICILLGPGTWFAMLIVGIVGVFGWLIWKFTNGKKGPAIQR